MKQSLSLILKTLILAVLCFIAYTGNNAYKQYGLLNRYNYIHDGYVRVDKETNQLEGYNGSTNKWEPVK
jgi:uncharacterized protein YxeA